MSAVPYFFLFGGYDLEMVEIRKLLEANGLAEHSDFADLHLGWGARLSAYADVLASPALAGRRFVGIELLEDMALPSGYLRVDHHNDLSNMPAAIVQVGELLSDDRYFTLYPKNLSTCIDTKYKDGKRN